MNTADSKTVMLVGGEDIHLRLAFMHELRERGMRVVAVGSAPQPAIEAQGFVYRHYPLKRALGPIADLRALITLRKIIANERPHLVHAFDTKPGFMVPLAMTGLKGPASLRTITGMGAIFSEDSVKNLILRRVYRLLHRLARGRSEYTIFQNTTDMGFFAQNRLVETGSYSLIRGSGVPIPDWGDAAGSVRAKTREKLGLGPQDFVFLMVARLVRQKGVADALAAAKAILPAHAHARFVFVGPSGKHEPDGVAPEDFKDESGRIMYLGRRDDVDRLLIASDVFVLPTKYREGVPRALLEALASGRPAIVSDMPGCADPVLEAKAGWVVPTGDISALKAAMQAALAQDRQQLSLMGARGRKETGRNYALKKVLAQTFDIYGRFIPLNG